MYRLLIAEDVDIIRNVLVKIIDWASLEVKLTGAASNGQEALEMMEKDLPDILLTDIRMPDMDGFRLILAAQEKYNSMKYIILTAHSDFNYAQNAIKLGVVDYVLKPVNKGELASAVEKAVQMLRDERKKDRQSELAADILKEKLPNVTSIEQHIHQDTNAKNLKIVDTAMEFIRSNLHKDISVLDVADAVFLNSKYLNTVFKQVTGENISKYIIKCKLEKAVQLLKDPSVKIYEVCDQLGYSSQNYFRDIFTSHYGVSPSEFRKRHI